MQEIYIDEIGNGVLFVLVHGFLGSNYMWMLEIEYFQKNYRVFLLALHSFGKSNKIESCDSIECIAQALLNSLKKNK